MEKGKRSSDGASGYVPLTYVFNGPMLVPWEVVEGVIDGDLTEAILLWQEAHREGHRYRENDFVAEVSNPRLRMTIRRILRKRVGEGEKARSQIIGFECYWWHRAGDPVPMSVAGARRVPGATRAEE